MDALRQALRKRSKLERTAAKAGVPEDKIDSLDDDALVREVVKARGVTHPRLDSLTGAALEVLLELEPPKAAPAAQPTEAPTPTPTPWNIQRVEPKQDAADEDPIEAMTAESLKSQGYGA